MTSVLITGSNRGIGLEFARQYAQEGMRVFATCRDPASATELQEIARASAGRVSVHSLDVTSDQSVSAAAQALAGEPLDILINNAGLGAGRNLKGHVDYAVWDMILQVNTIGPYRVAQAFRSNLMKSQTRIVVTLTNTLGSLTLNYHGNHTYRSSKAAVNRVMRALSSEWQEDGFRVVLLNPGWAKTDMGGPNATLPAQDSVAGMRKVIANLSPDENGRLLDYAGKEVPW